MRAEKMIPSNSDKGSPLFPVSQDNQSNNLLHLIGCASGIAGSDPESGKGPLVIQHSAYLEALKNKAFSFVWNMFLAENNDERETEQTLATLCQTLAEGVLECMNQQSPFMVIGGDHSCAIGTWSGVAQALLKQNGEMGLIWIDAHMDSHTPETTPSGNIHGMPLAVLLGHGYQNLTNLLYPGPKIKPEHLCLIGVRSFEEGEAQLLKDLNVRIYLMNEVRERGLTTVLAEAQKRVSEGTIGYGLSIDMDSIDPLEAPGVDVPEKDGIHGEEMIEALSILASDPKLIAAEIVEFDPSRDKNNLTEKLVVRMIEILGKGLFAAKGKEHVEA